MAARQRMFPGYPDAKEAPDCSYTWTEDRNPVLRGYPLVIAGSLMAKSTMLQKFIWRNAGFGTIQQMPSLERVHFRLDPTVIPLTAQSENRPSILQPTSSDTHFTLSPPSPGRFHSAADYHALYSSGAVTPTDIVEALLPLITRDATPRSKYELAFVDVQAERVLQGAAESTARWKAGKQRGVLDGVPIGVKCDVDCEGYISSIGMKVKEEKGCWRERKAASVAPVERLVREGAIVVGQNSMHELGTDLTGCNHMTGTPINWYNTAYYPGGSSSGAGSALSAGLVPICVGTDAAGSSRIPPAFCGVFGLKPTHHRTSVRNSATTDVCPMAATAADLRLAYRVMAQPDASTPIQGQFALSQPRSSTRKPTLAIPRAWVNRSNPAVIAAFDATVAYLRDKRGYKVIEDLPLPLLREGHLAHTAACLVEATDEAQKRTPAGSGDWLSHLAPANKILMSMGRHSSAGDYLAFGKVRNVIMQHLAWVFTGRSKQPSTYEEQILIITPTTPLPGWAKAPGDETFGFTDGNKSIMNMLYVWLANFTGCPAVSCPMGYAEAEKGVGSLPMGFMAMGEWGEEETLLELASDVEGYLGGVYPGGRRRPEEWVDVLGLVGKGEGGEARV